MSPSAAHGRPTGMPGRRPGQQGRPRRARRVLPAVAGAVLVGASVVGISALVNCTTVGHTSLRFCGSGTGAPPSGEGQSSPACLAAGDQSSVDVGSPRFAPAAELDPKATPSTSIPRAATSTAHSAGSRTLHTGSASTASAQPVNLAVSSGHPTSGSTHAVSGPLLGALSCSASDATLVSDGFRERVINAAWAEVEPSQGVFSSSAVAALQSQISAAVSAGLSPSLDTGVQYAPGWVFALPGGTHFTSQSGQQYTASESSGNGAANAVTDTAVRAQVGTYLAYLGSHLHDLASVRLGGGPDNELRYPSTPTGSFWFYDSSSQADLPAAEQGWTPGTGSTSQAQAFLTTYNAALNSYGIWQIQQAEADFSGSPKLLLLLPGWGQRSSEVSDGISGRLTNAPAPLTQGLDWIDLFPQLPRTGRIVAYTTYADATSGTSSDPDPAAYIHGMLPGGVLAGGENTGNGETDASGEALMMRDAKAWDWYVVNWFFTGQPQSPSQVSQQFSGS